MNNTIVPNFFFVGAPKTGSTSVYNYLGGHKDVFVPKLKEPHFFSTPDVENTYYETQIINDQQEYLDLFRNAKEKIITDFSTSYLKLHHIASQRIHDCNPDSKILIVIRNPVERALSHFLMDIKMGYVKKDIISTIENDDVFYSTYIGNGLYHEAIKSYFDVFGKEQVKVVLFDQIKQDTNQVISELCDFLEIEHLGFETEKIYGGYEVNNVPLKGFLRKIGVYEKFSLMMPGSVKEAMKNVFFDKNAEKPKFEIEKIKLQKYFEEDLIKTGKLLSVNLLEKWMIKG